MPESELQALALAAMANSGYQRFLIETSIEDFILWAHNFEEVRVWAYEQQIPNFAWVEISRREFGPYDRVFLGV